MKKIPIVLIFVGFVLIFSCNKNNTGKIMFWFREPISDQMVSRGVTVVKYYVDNEFIGDQSPLLYFSSAPQCGTIDLVTITRELGNVVSRSSNVEITDQDGTVLLSERINFSADECYVLELRSLLTE